MGISDRINEWVEDRRAVWGAALGKFILDTLSGGATKFIEDMEPDAIANMLDILEKIKTDPNTPPEVRAMVDRIEAGGHPIPLLIVIPLAILFLLPMLFALAQPLANLFTYNQERISHSYRADPSFIGRIWLRDKEAWDWLWDDLRDLGYDERRLAAAQELVKIIPPLADMVRFADFGSFDPEIIETWRQFYDAPSWITKPMSLLGITNEEGRDWANKYWFSHWRQPGRFELGEIYRRGLLGTPLIGQDEIGGPAATGPAEELVRKAYLTQGFSSFWQDHLLQLVREVPTRVDVRRWWDMRTIDEAELREIYQRQGYFGKDLENYVVWTKVYVAYPDLIARWTKGWITIDQVRSELVGLGMPAERVEEMIQTKIKPTEPERVSGERDLTKSDIYKGVKQGRITRDEAIELLVDLGFDEDEADYLLSINIPVDEVDEVVNERQLTKADILKGLKAKIITREDARSKLLELRYSATDAEFLLKIFDAQVDPPAEVREREASKADIVLGVKKGLITQEEGYGMLLDLAFTPEAAEFILMVKTEESPFSPINYTEFKELTGKYRVAAGMEGKPMTEELKAAAAEVVRVTGEVESLERSITEEKRGLIEEEVLPVETTKRLTKLQVKLHRAESELARVKSEYNRLIAEWRHGLP